MPREYPKQTSTVSVVYTDGEVRTFTITASNGIAHHLMNEAARTGVLVLRDDDLRKSFCIPVAMVRHVEIQTDDPRAVIEENPK